MPTDLEAEVLDKQKYIEETKETMEQNSRKLAAITQDINAMHGGETTCCCYGNLVVSIPGDARA